MTRKECKDCIFFSPLAAGIKNACCLPDGEEPMNVELMGNCGLKTSLKDFKKAKLSREPDQGWNWKYKVHLPDGRLISIRFDHKDLVAAVFCLDDNEDQPSQIFFFQRMVDIKCGYCGEMILKNEGKVYLATHM